jgi:hypothetical protein
MNAELWQAKVRVLAGFASGPAMLLEDDERDDRAASLLALVEMEYEATSATARLTSVRSQTTASITNIHDGEIHASNGKINWPELIDHIRAHPHLTIRLLYDKHHTAVVTAGRVNNRTNSQFDGITALTERRGDAGVVILSVD